MNTNTLYKVVNGVSLAYTDNGNSSDIPVIFIHGFPLDKSIWEDQIQAYSGKYRIITFDIRGFGESEEGMETFSIDLFTKDLQGFMDALELEKAVIVGFSMGGYIALDAMRKFPERIIGLALVDTQCQADTEEVYEKRMKACEKIRRESVSVYADEVLPALLVASEDGGDNSNAMIAIRTIIEGTSKDVLCNSLVAMANREATCATLKNIQVPTLLLVGEDDTLTPVEKAESMHAEIPGATLHVIPYAKHLSHIDNPEIFNRHLGAFLQRIHQQRSHLPEGSEVK